MDIPAAGMAAATAFASRLGVTAAPDDAATTSRPPAASTATVVDLKLPLIPESLRADADPRPGRSPTACRGVLAGRPGCEKPVVARLLGLACPLRAREVAVAGLDRDGPVALEVAHLDRPADDLGERSLAAILHQPDGAAHGGRAVVAVRAELALAVAPQLAQDRLRALLLRGRVRRRPRGLQRRTL